MRTYGRTIRATAVFNSRKLTTACAAPRFGQPIPITVIWDAVGGFTWIGVFVFVLGLGFILRGVLALIGLLLLTLRLQKRNYAGTLGNNRQYKQTSHPLHQFVL
jgi:hypothetical protein